MEVSNEEQMEIMKALRARECGTDFQLMNTELEKAFT